MRRPTPRLALWASSAVLLLILIACGGGSDSMRFDPELYKEHLVKIETLVQKPEADPDDGAALSNHVTVLAGAMGQNIENFRYRETVMNTLIQFGESYAALETQGVALDMPEVREGWRAMRDNLFEPADWFQ